MTLAPSASDDAHTTRPVAVRAIADALMKVASHTPGPLGDALFADALRIRARAPEPLTTKGEDRR